MLKLCLTVILLGCVTQINCENLPVFIWGPKTPTHFPALSHLSSDEFSTLVNSQTDKDTLTIVFVENSLSVENLSECRLKTDTCFENLRKIQKKTYLTAVEDPIKALKSTFGKSAQKSISLSNDGDLSEQVDTTARVVFINLEDVEDNEDFAKHDELMNKLYSSIAAKRENVIAIYTARHPSFVYSKPLIRKARNTEGKQEEEPTVLQHVFNATSDLGSILVAVSGITVQSMEGNPLPAPVVVDVAALLVTLNTTTERTSMNVNLKEGTHALAWMIELSGGTWSIRDFTYNGRRFFPANAVSSYDGNSYGCGDLVLSDAKTHINFANLQIQPHFETEEPIKAFSGRTNDCVGFFSAAIWGALFVVIMLVMILSCGLTAIMDIRTMDRFDDPKGKTIIINAQE